MCLSHTVARVSAQSHKITNSLAATHYISLPYGPRRKKTYLSWFAYNKGADQPAHPRRLVSAFVIHFLESVISKLDTGEISIFYLVPVAEETGLSLALLKP